MRIGANFVDVFSRAFFQRRERLVYGDIGRAINIHEVFTSARIGNLRGRKKLGDKCPRMCILRVYIYSLLRVPRLYCFSAPRVYYCSLFILYFFVYLFWSCRGVPRIRKMNAFVFRVR